MQQKGLILAAQSGDTVALNRLLSVCQTDARRYARRHCAASDVDDAVQEALLILSRKVKGLKTVAAFSGWLFTIVRRECQRMSRRMFGQGVSVEDLADAQLGVALWLIPRLLKTELVGGRYAVAGAVLWNLGVVAGIAAILSGHSTGLEWLEFPLAPACLLTVGGALMGVPLILTMKRRRVQHLYVSVWYLGAALLWFPLLYAVANAPGVHFGVEHATMNWWYGHNVLGLWFTPLGLAAAYCFIPKLLGTPVYSYNLSLLGFCPLAFFYSQVGGHHLIGGAVPSLVITLSIVQSMVMIVTG